MIHPADSDEDKEQSDDDDGKALAVKDDPEFTLAVTRGIQIYFNIILMLSHRVFFHYYFFESNQRFMWFYHTG